VSKLVFDGSRHRITLYSNGQVLGTWTAYNNVDRHATISHVRNGTYTVLDKTAPRSHAANANGPYGLHGIVRFNVPGHPGIGVHSGRALAKRMPGPQHPTMGCIRTTDEAMDLIAETMKASQLTVIEIVHNSPSAARAASARNERRKLHGTHHA
jgi:hypothetical protein